ncbi:hypothetical protein D3C79_419810 [compost metagenome]
MTKKYPYIAELGTHDGVEILRIWSRFKEPTTASPDWDWVILAAQELESEYGKLPEYIIYKDFDNTWWRFSYQHGYGEHKNIDFQEHRCGHYTDNEALALIVKLSKLKNEG